MRENDQSASYNATVENSEHLKQINQQIGRRIRSRRKQLDLSQSELGAAIGLTFQQVQKYESGANRIGAARLWEIAHVLKVSVTHFYDDLAAASLPGFREDQAGYDFGAVDRDVDDDLGLNRMIAGMEPDTRRAVMALMQTLPRRRP